MTRWLEITADYRCNQRCLGCFSLQPDGPSMSSREVADALLRGYRDGARSLWLGGGEPTLRRDALATASAARRMGYTRVKLQTNGMLLAAPGNAARAAAAGVTEVAFAIKGATAATHDRFTRTPGAHALLLDAMDAVRAAGLAMEGDVLVYRDTARELPDIVAAYTPRGVARWRVWLLTATDDDPEAAAQVPRMADVAPHLSAAMALGLSADADFITSLHTPPCVVPARDRACLFFARELALRVVNPGGHAFMLEESPMEGGRYLPGCAGCAYRPRCGGLRADYLDRFGGEEFRPVVVEGAGEV
jgi:MoaA/NifB/PqqE/SkfB family radical SAM enzyme